MCWMCSTISWVKFERKLIKGLVTVIIYPYIDLVICKITLSISDITVPLPHNGDNFPSNLKETYSNCII